MPLAAMINKIPMFEHSSDGEKGQIANLNHSIESFEKGETILKEGDDSSALYLIFKGTALVTRSLNGAHIRLAKLEVGEVFGEMSFFTKTPRKNTVIAHDDLLAIKIDSDFFEQVGPEISDKIKSYFIQLLIDRLDIMNDSITNLSKLMRLQ
jgi:CRP/FNR family transcriptional regulator, cyclic AMP receptor protein